MPEFTKNDVLVALRTSPDPKASEFAKDAELVKSLTAVLNATLKIAADMPKTNGQLALQLANRGTALIGVASKSGDPMLLKTPISWDRKCPRPSGCSK